MAVAITYKSGPRAKDLRTVLVEDVRSSVVLLPTGSLDVVRAKLVCGTSSACGFWADELGLPDAHDFAIPASAVRQQREIAIAVKVKTHKGGK
jgi:hypothetical protein